MPSLPDILVGLFVTWGVGLSPAIIARYWWKREPLRPRLATVIAATACIFFAILFLIVKSSLGGEQRISPAWVLVFFVSRAIMVHGSKGRVVAKLRTMLADPDTQSDRKEWARTQLARLGENADVPTNSIQSVKTDDLGSAPATHRTDRSSFLSSRALRLAALAFGGLIATNALILISGHQLLVGEQIVAAGEEVEWRDWIIGHQQRDVLLCRYWTGRSVQPRTEWYGIGPSELAECPIIG